MSVNELKRCQCDRRGTVGMNRLKTLQGHVLWKYRLKKLTAQKGTICVPLVYFFFPSSPVDMQVFWSHTISGAHLPKHSNLPDPYLSSRPVVMVACACAAVAGRCEECLCGGTIRGLAYLCRFARVWKVTFCSRYDSYLFSEIWLSHSDRKYHLSLLLFSWCSFKVWLPSHLF